MLILLDIDGVMVPGNSWKKPEFLNDGFPAFSTRATQALQKIISETSADILLTTSHKNIYTLEEWKSMFNERGLKFTNINRLPENTNNSSRKEEIINWCTSNKIEQDFIIIDDDKTLNALPENLKSKLVQTNASLGLTDELADEALKIIKAKKFIST
jgi:16S rRNA C1402 (ribose-2'-O) methylase RsmI